MAFSLAEFFNANNKGKKKAPPAQTVVKPKQSFGNKLVDIVSPNTQADQYRRQTNGQEQMYRNVGRGLIGGIDRGIKGFGRSTINDTLSGTIIEPLRSATAQITGNNKAMQAAELRKNNNLGTGATGMTAQPFANLIKNPINAAAAAQAQITGNRTALRNNTIAQNMDLGLGARGTNYGNALKKTAGDGISAATAVLAPGTDAVATRLAGPLTKGITSSLGKNIINTTTRGALAAGEGGAYNVAAAASSNPELSLKDAKEAFKGGAIFGGTLSTVAAAPSLYKDASNMRKPPTTKLVGSKQPRMRVDERAALEAYVDAERGIGDLRPSERAVVVRDATAAAKRNNIPFNDGTGRNTINIDRRFTGGPEKVQPTTGLVSRVRESIKNANSSLGTRGSVPLDSPLLPVTALAGKVKKALDKKKPIKSLEAEAKKYKNADEFVSSVHKQIENPANGQSYTKLAKDYNLPTKEQKLLNDVEALRWTKDNGINTYPEAARQLGVEKQYNDITAKISRESDVRYKNPYGNTGLMDETYTKQNLTDLYNKASKRTDTPASSGARAVLEANGVNISNRAARELVDDTRMQQAMNGGLVEPSRKTTQSAAETILQKSSKDNPISSSANTTPDPRINKYVKDYARTLRGIDEQSGVVIMPDGTRASSNSPFYRKIYAETGRKPTLKAWEAEARRQLDSGKGDSGAVKEYQQLVKESTDPEVQSLFSQAPGRELTPIQQNKRNAQSLKSEVQEFRDSLTPVKKTGGESNIPVRKMTQEGDVVTATNVNPKIKAGEKRYSVDDKTGELIPDKKGATSLFTDGEGKVTGFRVGKEYFNKEQIGDLSDVNGYGSSMATMRRNVERTFGKETGVKVNDFLVDHQQHQATKLVERQLSLKQGLQKQADNLGVNFSGNSKLAKRTSAAIQDFGEGKRSKASLVDEFGSDQAKKIVEADGWFKGQYDNLLTEMNKTLEEFGYPPVPKRKNYYTHFQEPKLWESFGLKMQEIRDLAGPTMQDANPTSARGGISNKLAGQSEFTSPNKAFNRFALQRKGGAYTSDAFKAFETYLRPTLNNIYMTPSIARARVLTKAIAQDADIMGKDANHIIIQTKEWANRLAGKSNRIDRPLIDTKGGQQYLKTAQWVQRKAGANTIVGNLSTAVMQPILLAQTAGKSGYKNTILAAMQEMSTAHGKNAPIRQSEFLRRRYADLSSVTDGKMAKVSDAVGTPLKVVEETAARISWNAAHNDALSKGLKGKQAIKYADVQAEKTLAGRSIGERPELYESKAAAPITMYQLEVNNFWQQFGKEMTKKQAAKTMVAAYGLNLLLQQATGRSVGFNPIDAAIDSYKETQKEEKSGIDKSKDVARRVAGEFVDNAPIVGPAINLAVGNENMKKVFGQSTNVGRFGVGSPLSAIASTTKVKVGDNKIPVPQNLVLPFGGGQVKKTIEGGQALRDGKLTDKDGSTTVDIPRTPANIVRGLAFGPSAIPEVKKYYDNTGKKKVDQVYVPNQIKSTAGTQSLSGLTKAQQEIVNYQSDGYSPEQKNKLIESFNKKNKADRQTGKTKETLKKSVKVGSETKTYDNQEQADVATGKKKVAFKGNDVYIKAKNKAGFTTKAKNEYEYDNEKSDSDLAIDRARSRKDVNAWYTAADKKINAIDKYKKTLDKDTDKVKINSLTKAQEDLIDEAMKYKGYGNSFTKGRSTGKGRGKGKGGRSKAYQYKLSDVLGSSQSISKSLRKLLQEAKI